MIVLVEPAGVIDVEGHALGPSVLEYLSEAGHVVDDQQSGLTLFIHLFVDEVTLFARRQLDLRVGPGQWVPHAF